MFKIERDYLLDLTANQDTPRFSDIRRLLEKVDGEPLSHADINLLVNAIHSSDFAEIRDSVIRKSGQLRQRIYGDSVVSMAPVEVTNRCASNCTFCGWRADNKDMRRLSITESLVLFQVEYLLAKGIQHIELVGGDDIKFVRDLLPRLVSTIKPLMRSSHHKVLFCTMALTRHHYASLRKVGADGIIMWQETYDKKVYDEYITMGPKAVGIDDEYKLVKGGDGYSFRVESQDRALQEGLSVSVGSMLGLNPNLGFEIIATVEHARYLERTYRPADPIIVGMPTWNNITTPRTDRRPERSLPIEDYFAFFASVYLLALHQHRAWVFPNCRVSLPVQVEAVRAAGVYTSTEVKLGPGGYLGTALSSVPSERRSSILDALRSGLKGEIDLGTLQSELDKMEQFQHHFHPHEIYVEALREAGLQLSSNHEL